MVKTEGTFGAGFAARLHGSETRGVKSGPVSPPLPTVATIGGAVGALFAPPPHGRGGTGISTETATEVGPRPEQAPKPVAVRGGFRPLKETLTPTLRTKIGTLTPLWRSSGLGV